MLGLQKTWNIVYLNIKKEKAQNIHRADCQLNWFTLKNMEEFLTLMSERSKFKIGAGQNVKH